MWGKTLKQNKGMSEKTTLLNVSFLLAANLDKSCRDTSQKYLRVRTGHGKLEESWNLRISFSWPWKSWKLIIVGHGKSWKIKVVFVRLVTGDVKTRTK